MVYLITRHWYPTHKAREVTEKLIEIMPKYPADETLGVQVSQCIRTTKKGVFVITTQEIKPGKLEEAMTRSGEYQVNFNDIEGLEWSMEVYYNLVEAMAFIGMKLPE